jgi:hypothetical protein
MVFSLNNPTEIESLFRAAGFVDVAVRAETKELDLPSPEDFLWQFIHSTPLSGMLAANDDEVRDALEREIAATWQPWVRDGGMRHQQGMIVTTARSAG